jgi:Protein phosphatase 2C
MPSFSTDTFLAPKRGSEAGECEDAFSVNTDRMCFCIADGATEGFASRYWARLLVKHWRRSERPILTPDQLIAWAAALGSRFDRRWRRRPLSWFAEEKARLGAYAAFVGLSFLESHQELHWQAIAIGDACLIICRQNAIVESFPLDDPVNFGFRPFLLPSNRDAQETIREKVEVRSAPVQPGDSFFLLTDAIAAWFLRAARSAPEEIAGLEQMLHYGKRHELAEFIEQARSDGSLRNDDVGIVRVRVAS